MADGYSKDQINGSQSLSNEILISLKSFWDISSEPWVVKDESERYLYANHAYLDFLQLPKDTNVMGKMDSELECGLFLKPFQLEGRWLLDEKSQERSSFLCILKNSNQDVYSGLIFDKFPLIDSALNIMGAAFHGKRPHRVTASDLFSQHPLPRLHFGYPKDEFTESEWDIVFLLFESVSRKEIASKLNKSLSTVNNKIQSIYDKTGVSSCSELLAYCKVRHFDTFIPPHFLR